MYSVQYTVYSLQNFLQPLSYHYKICDKDKPVLYICFLGDPHNSLVPRKLWDQAFRYIFIPLSLHKGCRCNPYRGHNRKDLALNGNKCFIGIALKAIATIPQYYHEFTKLKWPKKGENR